MKIHRDWIFFIGITPLLLNSLFPTVGNKPVVLIALITSLFCLSISKVSHPKLIRAVLFVATILLIAIAFYIYFAVLIHGYSLYMTLIYAQAYYVLPVAFIALACVIDFKRADTFFLLFIFATVLQHLIFGFQGKYISHHMTDGVSNFPGIIGHYHNSYIACFALILVAEIMSRVSRKTSIRNTVSYVFALILLGMPVFGVARGAILTNIIALIIYALVKLNKIRTQSIFQIVSILFLFAFTLYILNSRIDEMISEQNTYGYSGLTDVISVSGYSTEQNYTGRVDWWEKTLKETLSNSIIFGSVFENLVDGKIQLDYFNGSLMHSYYTGSLQDGGALLFFLIMYLLLYPIIIAFKRKTLQKNITKIIWLIAILGSLSTNTWMYNLRVGPIYAYLYAYATISILKASVVKSSSRK